MSAGSAVEHSERNTSQKEQAKTLQLLILPEKDDVTPRYDQKSFDIENQINTFVNIVSPKDKNDGNALWVHQQTFFNLGIF
jgi:redox-sensitive bicupin YhaK (pirin superfamily)